jgi:hypothetical protein
MIVESYHSGGKNVIDGLARRTHVERVRGPRETGDLEEMSRC